MLVKGMAFIVFEGLDACGKSTQLKKLEEHLKGLGEKVLVTREPGGTNLGEEIRELLLRTKGDAPVPRAELLLYEASRAQHVDRVIKPAIERGEWVLCDRCAASSVAFQAGGRALKKSDIEDLNHFATGGLVPDATVFIDITVDESEKRKGQRALISGEEQDRLEQEKRSFHEATRQSYIDQSADSSWLRLDGNHSVEEVFENMLKALKDKSWLAS